MRPPPTSTHAANHPPLQGFPSTYERIDADPRRQRKTDPHESSHRFHPFTSERFHVLLNPLFKVLFNFPSRYLFAIGLAPVFSLRWSLPPASGCILKQPDSRDDGGRSAGRRQRPCTRYGRGPARGDSDILPIDWPHPTRHSSRRAFAQGIQRWATPASLAVTKGIPVGFFSSA